jgi:hypothetical protein
VPSAIRSDLADGARGAVPTPTGRETALVALGQGAIMLLGGVLALLVAQLFGKNAKTDAFFAAYGCYAVGLTFAQTFRLTAVSRLVHADSNATITRLVGAVALISAGLALPMAALADPVGRLLVPGDPTGVAATTLRILWIALAGQLMGAMLAAVLAVEGAFAAIGTVSLLAGFVSVGTFLAVEGALGVAAAAVGLAVSSASMAAAYAVVLHRLGRRLVRLAWAGWRRAAMDAGYLTLSSATFIGANLSYVVCVAFATRQGSGEATLFAYAFVVAVMLVGLTANVSAMVRSPSVVASTDSAAAAAQVGVDSFRFALVLIGPTVAMTLLIGGPLIGVVLGSSFDSADVNTILLTLVCSLGWVLGSAAGIFAIVELLARRALRPLGLLAAAQVLTTVILAAVGSALAGIEGIALAISLAQLAAAAVQLRWAFGPAWTSAALRMAQAAGRELATIVAAFAPSTALVLLAGQRAVTSGAAALLAAALVVVASRLAWPHETQALLRLVPRLS